MILRKLNRIIELLEEILSQLQRSETPVADETNATVVRVIDGDTIEVAMDDGMVETVRLVGVDCPETEQQYQNPEEFGIPDTVRGREWLRQWGYDAQEFTTETLNAKRVAIHTDTNAGSRDWFGRLLAYVTIDGQDFNESLVEEGLARVYTGEMFTREEYYLAVESTARNSSRGLWGFDK